MGNIEKYMVTARNTKGSAIEYANSFPMSVILGNEDYYINITQAYIDTFDSAFDSEGMDVLKEIRKRDSEYYTAIEIIDMAREFLSTLDEGYVKDFDDMVNSGHLIITTPDDISIGDPLDTDDEKDYNKACFSSAHSDVVLPMHNNIVDVGTLVHEFMHYELDLHKPKGEYQEMMYIFNEMNAIFHEFLYYDYVNDNEKINNDCRRDILRRLLFRKIDAENVNLDAKIIQITDRKLPIVGLEYDKDEAREIFLKLKDNCEYFIGGVFGAVLFDRYKKGIINYKNVKNFVEALPTAGYDTKILNFVFDDEHLEFTKEEINDAVKRLFDEFDINSLKTKKVL